jgi:anti-anti-sigma factor
VPAGELDIATVPAVDAQLGELRDAGFLRLVLDLRQVTFMDVRGLRLILDWSQAGGVAFAVIPGPPQVQRIFTLTATAGLVTFGGPGRFQRSP